MDFEKQLTLILKNLDQGKYPDKGGVDGARVDVMKLIKRFEVTD